MKKNISVHLLVSATFEQLYSNLYSYPLYIGVCLLLMLIYSVIYLILAIYIERINPGEFGIAQPWNYLFKKSYWSPKSMTSIQPTQHSAVYGHNVWVELNPISKSKEPSLSISHLTKVRHFITLFHLISLLFVRNSANFKLYLISH